MKGLSPIVLFMVFFMPFLTAPRAQETSAAKMYSVDKVLERVMQSYQSESLDMFKTAVFSSSPQAGEMIEKAKKDFEKYDTVTFTLHPYSTIFYKKFGYPRIDVRVKETLRGVDVKKNTQYETTSDSSLEFLIDDDGSYSIVYWKKIPAPRAVIIKKED